MHLQLYSLTLRSEGLSPSRAQAALLAACGYVHLPQGQQRGCNSDKTKSAARTAVEAGLRLKKPTM
jgi:hypothetical protein